MSFMRTQFQEQQASELVPGMGTQLLMGIKNQTMNELTSNQQEVAALKCIRNLRNNFEELIQ